MACVDNSDYMRNGDYMPTRLQAQQDAVNLVCHAKMRQHPENNVGLVTLGGGSVLLTLTSDVGRILSKLHDVQPCGNINFLSSVRIAQLALKHRQGKNHKQRIVAFVGSPVECDDKDLIKLAKRLKKEKVSVDVINFGDEGENDAKLSKFIDNINGKEGTSSHLVTVPPGPMLSDALVNSPVVAGEDGQIPVGGGSMGGGFGFDFDPNEDPELALALRVSMEEQRARQEAEARKTDQDPDSGPNTEATALTNEEARLQSALAMSVDPTPMPTNATSNNFANMTEEQQIAMALQMSLAMDTETTPAPTEEKPEATGAEDFSEDLNDPEFLQGVLRNLPGVDPQSEEIQSAMSQLTKKDEKKEDDKKDPQ